MRSKTLSALLCAPVLSTACGDATGVEQSDLAGVWNATRAVFTSTANSAVSVDVIALGGSLTLAIDAAGNLTLTITDPIGGGEIETGTIVVNGSSVTVTVQGDPSTGTISLDGDTATLNLTSGVEFDFDDDGTDDPATLELELEKQ